MRYSCVGHVVASWLSFLLVTSTNGAVVRRPYFTVSPNYSACFTMIPDPKTGGGQGTASTLGTDGSSRVLWRTEGWYASKLYLSDDGRYLVRIGEWPAGSEPSPQHIAVAFYDQGNLLKSYSTSELVKDPTMIVRAKDCYQWLSDGLAGPRIDPELDWSGKFNLTTIDGVRYQFNVATGNIISQQKHSVVGWASPGDIDRLCLAVPLTVCPFPLSKIRDWSASPPTAVWLPAPAGLRARCARWR